MVNAGRILIMPRGEWDALTSYNMLDLVTKNGVAYLAKQANVGQDPALDTTMTYWQTFGSAVVPDNDTIIYDGDGDLAVNLDGTTLKYDAVNSYIKVAIDGVTLKYDSVNGYIYADVSTSLAGLDDVQLTSIQNGQIIAYNSTSQKFVNIDLPVGGGSKIKVTTAEATLYGQTVTLSDGVTTLSGTFSNSGEYTFEGVELTGNLTISSSDGNDRATRTLYVQYYSSYAVSLAFFEATVTVTFPYTEGASCTLSDGVTTLTATTSPMAFSVPNTGTWTASVTLDGASKTDTVTITTDGQTEALTIEYGTINVTYDNDFRGVSITCTQGGTTITKTAPSGGNTMAFYPPTTGTWTIAGTVGGQPYSTSATITTLSTSESAILQTLVQITATIYSATEDTVTFTDAAGVSHTEVFASGQSSKSITFKILPTGSSITFTSSVAKDPDNLSNNYTKTISLTSSTTEVYVMPDNALFWWGYKTNDVVGTPNGVNFRSTWTSANNAQFNTYDITISTPVSGACGSCMSTTTAYQMSKLNAVAKSNSTQGSVNICTDASWLITADGTTNVNGNVALADTSNAMQLFTATATDPTRSCYVCIDVFGNSVANNASIYAVWYE